MRDHTLSRRTVVKVEKTAGVAAQTARRLAVDNQAEPAIIADDKLQSRKALSGTENLCPRAQDSLHNGRVHKGVYWCYRLPIFLRVAQE